MHDPYAEEDELLAVRCEHQRFLEKVNAGRSSLGRSPIASGSGYSLVVYNSGAKRASNSTGYTGFPIGSSGAPYEIQGR
jgi:hypothetical protein